MIEHARTSHSLTSTSTFMAYLIRTLSFWFTVEPFIARNPAGREPSVPWAVIWTMLPVRLALNIILLGRFTPQEAYDVAIKSIEEARRDACLALNVRYRFPDFKMSTSVYL